MEARASTAQEPRHSTTQHPTTTNLSDLQDLLGEAASVRRAGRFLGCEVRKGPPLAQSPVGGTAQPRASVRMVFCVLFTLLVNSQTARQG